MTTKAEEAVGRPPELLRVEEVPGYLADRGVLDPGGRAELLTGGVSNAVFGVTAGIRRVVCKQALGRLRVAERWTAPPDRVLTEADALRTLAALTPDDVPRVLDVDPERLTLTIERAPDHWRDWRSLLLAGRVDPVVGERLGRVLARWHTATAGGERCPPRVLAGEPAFEALRLEPFYEVVAQRRPDQATRIRGVAERTRRTRHCLVHGDFSPKNVLVPTDGERRLWVIDLEVAHLGDPAFDLGFLLGHLACKAVHDPARAAAHQQAAVAFVQAYRRSAGPAEAEPVEPDHLSDQVACLLLARVHGRSPAGYLSDAGRAQAARVGTDLLRHPAPDVPTLFATVEGARP